MSAETPSASEDSEAESGHESLVKYGLMLLLVGVVALGLLRPFYPTLSALAIGSLLALFGAAVGVLAFRERGRES